MDYIVDNNTVTPGLGDTPPATGTPGEATNGNPIGPVPRSIFPAWAWNMILGSCRNVIVAAGLIPSRFDRTLLGQAVSIIGRRQSVYGSSATITVPAGVYRMRFRGWGGGGGGGNGNGGGGGGGAAGGAFDIWAPVSPGQSVTITIGAGGSSGVNGGTTVVSVNGVSVASAAGGGSGGLGTSGGIGAGSTYFGTASGAGYNLYGSSGSNGVASSSVLIGGAGGNANSFQGGPSQVSIAGTNAAGNGGQTGSGGGGGVGNGAGGAGGGGVVFLEY